jgi:hypothetical protein
MSLLQQPAGDDPSLNRKTVVRLLAVGDTLILPPVAYILAESPA